MKVRNKKFQFIQREIRQSSARPISFRHWMSENEPLIMLALVACGIKKGATLPAHFTRSQIDRYRQLLEKLKLPYTVRSFIPPSTGAKRWIIDVARDKRWLEKFNKEQLPLGTFYGYPRCCQCSYFLDTRQKRWLGSYSLRFIGLVPCKRTCLQAKALAVKCDQVISSLLLEEKYRAFRNYWAQT